MFQSPGPCIVCGTAHTACKGSDDDSDAVGVTRGVIVRQVAAATRVVVNGEAASSSQPLKSPSKAAVQTSAQRRRKAGTSPSHGPERVPARGGDRVSEPLGPTSFKGES